MEETGCSFRDRWRWNENGLLLINENGDIIEAKTIATVSYKHVGMDNSIALLKRNGSRNFE